MELTDPSLDLEPSPITVHPGTLGVFAVQSFEAVGQATQAVQALREAMPAADESIHPDLTRIIGRYETAANANLVGMSGQLESLAVKLGHLEPYQEKLFNDYFDEVVPASFKAKVLYDQLPDGSWAKWLAGVGAEDQLTFWQWHVGHIEKYQIDTEVQAAIDSEKQSYKTAVQRGIQEEWLCPEATTAFAKTDQVKVYVGDVFDTAMQERDAYHVMGSDEIIIATPIEHHTPGTKAPIIAKVRRLMKHELNHAVLGDLGARWLREAVTHHIALVMDHGSLDVIDPQERADGDMVYMTERKLLHTLLNMGTEQVPVKLATCAYSARGLVNRQATADDFENALERAWGKHLPGNHSVLTYIDLFISRREMDLQRSNPQKPADQRLTPLQIRTQAVLDVTAQLEKVAKRRTRIITAGEFALETTEANS